MRRSDALQAAMMNIIAVAPNPGNAFSFPHPSVCPIHRLAQRVSL
jgi:hypothetical protein